MTEQTSPDLRPASRDLAAEVTAASTALGEMERRLRTLAQRWLAAHDEHAPELRFDVVGVLVRPARPALVTHLRAAFS